MSEFKFKKLFDLMNFLIKT